MISLVSLLRKRNLGPQRRAKVEIVASEVAPLPAEALATAREMSERGDFAGALHLLDLQGSLAAGTPDFLAARAAILFRWGRYRESLRAAILASEAGCVEAGHFATEAWCLLHAGDATGAQLRMRRAIDASPGDNGHRLGLAKILHAAGDLSGAQELYLSQLARQTDDAECWFLVGVTRLDLGDSIGAEEGFRHVVRLLPRQASAWNNLGIAQSRQGRHDDAMQSYQRAYRFDSEAGSDVDAFSSLANAMMESGDVDGALQLLAANLDSRPSIAGYCNLALALLSSGRLPEGCEYNEFRWLREPLLSLRARYSCPVWSGQDLNGKTIVVRGEQGFGDVIQLLRYIPLLQSRGARVMLRLPPGLDDIAGKVAGVEHVLGPDERPEFDYYIPMMTLPLAFRTTLASIPGGIPYIQAESDRVQRWKGRLGETLGVKVGIVWAGSPQHTNDRYRSVPLAAFAGFAAVDGIRLYSLQRGERAADVGTVNFPIENIADELETFSDTAAAIQALDLVICVDTSVAHLAGAMGVPVWTLVAAPADWRWLTTGSVSPWYPTMRLFRQTSRGEWQEPIDCITKALTTLASAGPGALLAPEQTVPETMAPLPFALPSGRVAETRYGIVQYIMDGRSQARAIREYGEFLPQHLRLLAPLIGAGSTVVQIGAGVGLDTLPLSAKVGDEGDVLCYEASHVCERILRQNLHANRIRNVTIMRRLIAGRAASYDTSAMIGAKQMNEYGFETLDDLKLKTLALLFVNQAELSMEVLDGAVDTLWRLRPAIFVRSLDKTDGTLPEVSERLHAFGYKSWVFSTEFYSAENFNRSLTDIFDGAYCRALLALPEENPMVSLMDVELGSGTLFTKRTQ